MGKSISSFLLVRSMTKAEKRYFRLYENLQGGPKIYGALFDLFDKSVSLEEALEGFADNFPDNNPDVAVKYLYATLLDCLIRLRSSQDAQQLIFKMIAGAEILFERGLCDDAFRELNRAKKQAEIHRQDVLLLLARQTELRLLSARNFADLNEKQLVGKQIRVIDLLKRIRNVHWHNQLYDILKHRFHHKGYARSSKEQEGLNDLLLHELNLVANGPARRFETEELHALFQATYFLSVGNYPSALRHYRGLIARFEENRSQSVIAPAHYRQALRGILDTLLATGLYDEIPYFTAKLTRAVGVQSAESELNDLADSYLYNSLGLLHCGRFDEAAALRERFEEPLFRKIHLLGLAMQLRLWLHLAVFGLFTARLPEAKKQMKKIMASGKLLYAFPGYKAARMVNLLLQAESDNHEFVTNEIAALRREIRLDKRQRQYAVEKLLFRFVQAYPLPFDRASRLRLWTKFEPQVEKIRQDKYERSLLVVCDFPAWIQSRLTSRPLAEILAEQARTLLP